MIGVFMTLIINFLIIVSANLDYSGGVYGSWNNNSESMSFSCDFKYPLVGGGFGRNKVVIYYADEFRKNWVYFFNEDNVPWVRCYIKPYSKTVPALSFWQFLNATKNGYENYSDSKHIPTPPNGISCIPKISLPEKLLDN